jgi:chorismate-pyruvate lyase
LQALLACSSATTVIEQQFGAPVIIRRVAMAPLPPPAPQACHLQLQASDLVIHRRVMLAAAGTIVSEADLWYVPARLPADMQRALIGTDVPFGRVIAPLGPQRETLDVRLPAPERGSGLEIDAVLRDRASVPIALVRERYCSHPPVENAKQSVSHGVLPEVRPSAAGE